MTDAGSYNPAFVSTHGSTVATAEAALFAGLVAGQTYFNIHTPMFGAARSAASFCSPDRDLPDGDVNPKNDEQELLVPVTRPAPGAKASDPGTSPSNAIGCAGSSLRDTS